MQTVTHLALILTRSLLRYIILLLMVCLLAPIVSAEPTVVSNSAEPKNGVRQLELKEQWRIGGADDEENFFGLVTWAEIDETGLLYVMDAQLNEVNVYDQEGGLVRTLFGEGDGPGEVRDPRDLVLLADGSIGVVQEFPGKVIKVDREGAPAGSFSPSDGDPEAGGLLALTSADYRAGTMVLAGVSIRPGDKQGQQERHMFLSTSDSDGVLQTELLSSNVQWDFTNFVYDEVKALPTFWWANAVGPDGRIYAAPDRDAYRINVYSKGGQLEKIVEREYDSWQRTSKEMEWNTALFKGAFRNLPFELDLRLSDTESDICWLNRGLQVDNQGQLWVLPSRGIREQPDGVMATFDVFDTAGIYDHQVQVVCPEADGAEDAVILLGDGRALVIKGFVDATASMFGGGGVEEEESEEAEPMELICYSILPQ
ncbi:MAG: hypothetical protein ACI9UQ_002220 [Candidatus Krumholzibacteriia bacterium]|jgi:hypothetical protein